MKDGKMRTIAKKPHKRSMPGEFVQDFLDDLGITQYRLAKDTHIPHPTITKIMRGDSRITANIALRLSIFFGNTPQFWLNCQNAYDLFLLEKERGKEIHKIVKPLESRSL